MNDLNIDLNILAIEPAEAYHARAGECLSSHQLLDFMRSPWLFHKKAMGLIEEEDSPAYLVGRAAHARILEGRDVYESRFAVGGPVNPKTGKPYGRRTKTWREWAEAQASPVLSLDEADLIEQMACGVAMNDAAVELLLYGRAEGVVRAEVAGTACQARIDWTHPHRGIVDLKTTRDLDRFEYDARDYRYVHQMAFYRAVLAEVIAAPVPVWLVAVEKQEPFRCGVWRVADEALGRARRAVEVAIRRLARCRRDDLWPTGYEEIRVLDAA